MNRSIIIAIFILLALCLYMLTGFFGDGADPKEAGSATAEVPGKQLMTVKVRRMEAVEIPREVVVSGKTVPSRSVKVKAETLGRIIYVADKRGQVLEEGELIAEIQQTDRPQRLAQAEAALEQAGLEYEAALRLQKQDLRSASQMAEALSRLRGAEQLLRMIEIDLERTRMEAPFQSVLQARMVEVGDYVGIGDPVARLIDLDPIYIRGEVTEFQFALLHEGEEGRAELPDGRTVSGLIGYVAAEADSGSRTFGFELEVANPDLSIPAGITARIAIETERVGAYEISPGLISIADDGRFGVKYVDAESRVRFVEADIVKSEPNALWLSGLPDSIQLITVGQGFTQPGDKVQTVLESGSGD